MMWLVGLLLLLAGGYSLALLDDPTRGALLGAGVLALAWRAGARRSLVPASMLALASWWLAPFAAVAVLATAAQLLLADIGRSPSRRAFAFIAHGVVTLATFWIVVTATAFSPATGLAYAAGFSALLLRAHWARPAPGWDAVLLALVVVGLSAMSLLYTASLDVAPKLAAWLPYSVAAATFCGLLAFSLVARPPPAPRALQSRAGIALDVLAHGGACIALLNVLFLGLTLVSAWSLKTIFAVLFGWQLLVIGMEYRAVRHAERRRRRGPAQPLVRARRPGPVTVIVPAANEGGVLPQSLSHNLAVPYPLKFIVVPASKSKDDTVAVAHRFARRHPDRVRVIEGTTGSKAEDLNLAWRSVDTPFVLLLDADETIDEEALLRGLETMQADPAVGVVQGRKVSRAPEERWLARFISAERRYCTWLDHVLHGDQLGSAHFGGSAALIRRQVPPSVGGWTERTMTEDIEFTLRVHLDDRWKIVYRPEMVVRECDPANVGELMRQRTRWARGWAQCFQLYFGDVVRARRRLGRGRTFGLTLLLLISVSTLWTTLVPATLMMRFAGISPLMPIAIAIPLTLLLLPSRMLAYSYAAFRDPVIPVQTTPKRFLELAAQAYLWIVFGWFVQLHALYLEVSSAPRVWYVTGKRAAAAKAGGAA